MTSTKSEFLERVSQAVRAGNQVGQAPSLPARDNVGYQGAGSDLAGRFAAALTAAGGECHRVATAEKAVSQVAALVHAQDARRVVLGRSDWFDSLHADEALQALGVEVWRESSTTPASDSKQRLFAADVGITGVDWLIAETGSVVLAARPGQARSLSLLPPIHIALAQRSQLLPDLFDLFSSVPAAAAPACLTIITGPSKTGDIELRLVTGVHGPKEIHVVLVD
jgi:L-lactate utilization protein LutC